MIKQTKRKLIVMYSGLIGCILTIMVLLFYAILSSALSRTVENQLALTSKKLIDRMQKIPPKVELSNIKRMLLLETRRKKGIWTPIDQTYISYDFVPLNHFFILVSADGKIMLHSLQDNDLFTLFQSSLANRSLDKDTLSKGDRSFKLIRHKTIDGSMLYTGTEATDNVNLLHQMRWVLALMSLLILAVSVGMGFWFSGRAMVPIQRSYKRQQDFVADASHELRTPLCVIRTGIEILEEEQQSLPAFHRKVLIDMKKELLRMTRMTDHLLTLARSDSGRLELQRCAFDLPNMVKSTFESFQLLAEQNKITLSFTVDMDGHSHLLFGDEERLKQLLYILLDNALKYNKPGGHILLSVSRTVDAVQIDVSDTGIGIPPNDIPFIFERFYRADKGRSRSQGGVGLGLSIASWIVSAHGGQLKVRSEYGTGTTIQTLIPV